MLSCDQFAIRRIVRVARSGDLHSYWWVTRGWGLIVRGGAKGRDLRSLRGRHSATRGVTSWTVGAAGGGSKQWLGTKSRLVGSLPVQFSGGPISVIFARKPDATLGDLIVTRGWSTLGGMEI